MADLQERYFQAFEEKLFPIDMLQEKLKHIADEKTSEEQGLIELKSKLSQSRQKHIPPELVKDLLQKFVHVYEVASREQKKLLIQLS